MIHVLTVSKNMEKDQLKHVEVIFGVCFKNGLLLSEKEGYYRC